MRRLLLRLGLVFSIACFANCNDYSNGDIPKKSAFLGGDIRSGASWVTLRQSDSLTNCEWTFSSPDRPNAAPAESESGDQFVPRIETVATSNSCRHLGETGSMRLDFINDRLMALEITPNNASAYREAIKNELGKTKAVKVEVQPQESTFVLRDDTRVMIEEQYSLLDNVSVRILRKGDVSIIRWSDLDLVAWAISL